MPTQFNYKKKLIEQLHFVFHDEIKVDLTKSIAYRAHNDFARVFIAIDNKTGRGHSASQFSNLNSNNISIFSLIYNAM